MWVKVWYSQTGHSLQYNTLRALCILDSKDHRHTPKTCNTYCFSMAKMVMWQHLNVPLHFDLHNKAELDAQVIQRQMRAEVSSIRRCSLGYRIRQGRMECSRIQRPSEPLLTDVRINMKTTNWYNQNLIFWKLKFMWIIHKIQHLPAENKCQGHYYQPLKTVLGDNRCLLRSYAYIKHQNIYVVWQNAKVS
jgi:hypothetical protein